MIRKIKNSTDRFVLSLAFALGGWISVFVDGISFTNGFFAVLGSIALLFILFGKETKVQASPPSREEFPFLPIIILAGCILSIATEEINLVTGFFLILSLIAVGLIVWKRLQGTS